MPHVCPLRLFALNTTLLPLVYNSLSELPPTGYCR